MTYIRKKPHWYKHGVSKYTPYYMEKTLIENVQTMILGVLIITLLLVVVWNISVRDKYHTLQKEFNLIQNEQSSNQNVVQFLQKYIFDSQVEQ